MLLQNHIKMDLTPLLPPDQEAIRLRAFHPSGVWTPLDTIAEATSLLAYFAQQVRERPGHPAIQLGRRGLTYADVDQQSTQLALAIRAQVGDASQAVGLLLADATLTILAVLAIWKAGKFLVVLDEQEPHERLAYICHDAQAACLLTDRATVELAKTLTTPTRPCLTVEDALLAPQPTLLALTIAATLPARLSYSSGSTGQPKGILHTHGHLLNDAAAANAFFHIGPHDRFLYFMVGFELFASVATGATIVPLPLRHVTMRALADVIHQEAITTVRIKPTVFRQLIHGLDAEEQFATMRLVHMVGEATYRRDVEMHRKHVGPDGIMVVTLGAQEALNYHHYLVGRETVLDSDRVPVGYAMSGRTVSLLDDAGQPVAPGEIGEIAVQSRYLSPGYWHRDDLNATKFWPASDDGAERTYLTGDLGYFDERGRLFHMGRKDFRLKIHGYTVEPAEIEVALLNSGLVKDAVVTAFPDPRRHHVTTEEVRLVAYLVAAVTPPPSVTDLRQRLRQTLPEYMMPSFFIVLDVMPMLPGGKVNRQALPPPDKRRPELNTAYVPARDPVEAQLVALWEEVLAIHGIGVQDDFFDLGGHSIALVNLLAKLKTHIGQTLDAVTFLRLQTIENLAAHLRTAAHTSETPSPLTNLDPQNAQLVARYVYGETRHLEQPTRRQKWLDQCLPLAARMRLFHCLGRNRAIQHFFFHKECALFREFATLIDLEAQGQRLDAATAHFLMHQLCHRYCSGVIIRAVRYDFARWVDVTGQTFLETAHQQGKGVILVDVHRLIPPGLLSVLFQQLGHDQIMQYRGKTVLNHHPALVDALKAYFGDPNETSITAKFLGAQFDAALRMLERGGIVRMVADGLSGSGDGLTYPVFGRQYSFKSGFAELALRTGAPIIPMRCGVAVTGKVHLTFFAPLDVGLPTTPHAERIRALVGQYVDFLTASWQQDASNILPAYIKQYFARALPQNATAQG